MRIGELAGRTGVSVRALRYYEEQGLLRSDRTPGGQREYADSAVAYVRFFQNMYAAGLTSKSIAELMPCFSSNGVTASQRAMLDRERARLDAKIAELQAARTQLDGVIAAADARRVDHVA